MTTAGARPTQRDRKLFRTLHAYGPVTSRQLGAWFFAGVEKTTVLRRLRRLEEGGFIRRRGTLPDGTAVFLPGSEGARTLGENLPTTTYPLHLLNHEIEVNALRWELERLGVVKSWMTERTLRSEIVRRNPSHLRSQLIVPDALILFRHFLEPQARVELEMELHAKSDARYRTRFQKFHPTHQKSQAFHWYWVATPALGRRILEIAEEHGGQRAEEFVGFTVIPEFQAKGLDATLVWNEERLPLHDAFEIPCVAPPAQGAAQGLSRQNPQTPESASA